MMISTVRAFIVSPSRRYSSTFVPRVNPSTFSSRRPYASLLEANNKGKIETGPARPDSETKDKTETDTIRLNNVSDSIRRRQLLFSLLAASGATAVRPSVVHAEEAIDAKSEITVKTPDGKPVQIMLPPLDDRDFATYILGNGLRVLLCSDPSTNSAGVAMDVHVGACSDPDDIPGLAHFCEHMLFLGTEKYPIEDSFETFLSSNGGQSNAFTDNEDTVYYFDMAAESYDKFKEGLLRFGSFFSGPLFTESATGRELNAIESENAKNLQSDVFRLYQVRGKVRCLLVFKMTHAECMRNIISLTINCPFSKRLKSPVRIQGIHTASSLQATKRRFSTIQKPREST